LKDFLKQSSIAQGLHRFGQSTLLGVYRWIVLSFIADFLASSAYLGSGANSLPDWGDAARLARETLLPSLVVLGLLININRSQRLARHQGFDITVSCWQYG
jgi:hypothetical protein